MHTTGSIAIASAVLRGRGVFLWLTGLLVLLVSAVVHATFAHLAAALVFGVSIVALHLLSRADISALGTPWAAVVRLTDLLSLAVLAVATFGPLAIVATGGSPGWDVPVLGGVLLVWWSALDALVADYRRIRVALLLMVLAWVPVVTLHPTQSEIAYAVEALAVLGVVFSTWSFWRSMRGVPSYYRVIDVDRQER